MNLSAYSDLKGKLEARKRDYDRAVGAFRQAQSVLKKEFGCATIAEAKHLLAKKTRERDRVKREYDLAMEDLLKKYGHLLEAKETD